MGARIDGLDVARALAVLGMFGSHVGHEGEPGIDDGGWSWLVITHGYPSALFAVLAGVSITLMATSRGTVPIAEVPRDRLAHTRVRVAVRAALLLVISVVLHALDTPVAIILGNLGVMMVVASAALRWRTPVLLAVAAVCATLGGAAAILLGDYADAWGVGSLPVLVTLWGEHYPVLAWLAYLLVGIAIGRTPVRSVRSAVTLLGVGGAVGAVAMVAEHRLADAGVGMNSYPMWVANVPHVYTPLMMIGTAGVAVGVIGLCLLIVPRVHGLLWPLAATGSMALTVYTAHIIVIAIAGDDIVWDPSHVGFLALSLGAVAFACLWRATLGQGPLERLLTRASNRAAAAFLWRRGVEPHP